MKFFSIMGLLGFVCAACSGADRQDPTLACDPKNWIATSPKEFWHAPELSSDRYAVLSGSLKERAIRNLAERSFYASSMDEIQASGLVAFSKAGFQAYTVRAVGLNVQGGRWSVKQIADALSIEHGVLTGQPIYGMCEALIVLLDRAPNRLFIAASGAQ
jgi:hypothetical protein